LNSTELKILTDLELIAHYRESSDNVCVGILFERYTVLVFGVCMKYFRDEDESKDAVMQIFEKLLSDLARHEINNFKSWLFSVARNHCLMAIRKSKGVTIIGGEAAEIITPFMEFKQYQHQEHADRKESQLQQLEEAMKQLNEEQRTCVELFYLKEKCYQEIADLTGYTLNQVKSFIQNGKRNLKNNMSATAHE
jgi:RNA polymerase sigma factor (sigma-70 family)